LLYLRLKALAFTLTLLAVNVLMFPSDPSVAELPVKLKVPGAHAGGGVGVGEYATLLGANGDTAKTGMTPFAKNTANKVITDNVFLIV
jgi:hypothetical protein